MDNKKHIKSLAESGILIALATILSLIVVYQLPLGGSITLCSMLPIVLISIRRGNKWGLLSSFIYSIIQLVIGIVKNGILGWSLTPIMLIGCIVLDYIIPYTALGLSGLFRNKGSFGILIGVLLSFLISLSSHVLSGYVIFTNLEQWELFGEIFSNTPLLYSFAYNVSYILPELLMTYIVLIVMLNIPYVKNNLIK